MQVQVDHSHFSRALQLVGRAISGRASMPILTHILLAASKNTLSLTATDLELGIETHIAATVREPGNITLPGRILTDIAASLPDAPVDISTPTDEPKAHIACGRVTFDLAGLPAADFPAMPDHDRSSTMSVNADILRPLIRHALVAVSTDETRPFLTGVLMALHDTTVRFAATDGGRLAVRSARITDGSLPDTSALVPARSVRELTRALGGNSESVRLTMRDNQAVFSLQNTRFISRLIAGQFPAYEGAIPTQFVQRVVADRNRLLDAVRRVRITAKDASNVMRFSVSDSTLTITSNTPSVGQAREEIPVRTEGEPVTAAFNATFVVDALETIDSAEVALNLTGPLSPAVIRPRDDTDGLHVLAPVRVYG